MVTSLRYFKKDPNKKGRGTGVYYHRGHGYYSKYSTVRDSKIKARGYKTHKIGLPKGSGIKHTSDGRLPR